MTIGHWNIKPPDDNTPFVFAELMGFTCSICAPNSMVKVDVENFANETYPGEPWQSVNKSEIGLGSPTPNPCNHAPDQRTHWFMMRPKL